MYVQNKKEEVKKENGWRHGEKLHPSDIKSIFNPFWRFFRNSVYILIIFQSEGFYFPHSWYYHFL